MPKRELSFNNDKVLSVLSRSNKPLSAYDLLDRLSEFGLKAPPTIYRALDALIKKGLIHRIESLNAYVACHGHDHHHTSQFAVCTSCHNALEIEDDSLSQHIQKMGDKFLGQIQGSVIELLGTCRSCLKKNK